MGRFKRVTLQKLCLAGVISVIDYWKICKSRKRKKPRIRYIRANFLLNSFTDEECLVLFRFKKIEIRQLVQELGITRTLRLSNRLSCSGEEGLCIGLRRLTYPNRWNDLVQLFHRDPTALSRISNYVLNFIFDSHCHLLTTLNKPLVTNQLREFAQCCVNAGSWYPHIIGFIDGTARRICRPKYNQRVMYSGYKKQHLLKYQSVLLPNGLIGRLDGPFVGRRHDSAILSLRKLRLELENICNLVGNDFALYGDVGYSNQKFVKVGFKNYGNLTMSQTRFNSEMAALRVSVEYGFGKICSQFAFLDFRKNQKVYLQHLKVQYFVAALLVNCQTCMRGDRVSEFFDCSPPTLHEYLSQ